MNLTIEKLDHLIDLLEVDEEHISLKEVVYLQAMRVAREQLLKKPVTWARRATPERGLTEEWASPSGYLCENDPKPDGEGYYEYKPLYDK